MSRSRRLTPKLVFALFGMHLGVLPADADATQWALRDYLQQALEHQESREEHRIQREAERLNLKDGERSFWPDVELSTGYEEATEESEASGIIPDSRSVKSGLSTGIDTTWRSWVGTEVTLGLEHQYGHQLGKTGQGIPEDDLSVDNLSFEISQPLLKHNTLAYNQLKKRRARAEWQQYELTGEQNRLSVLKEALSRFLDLQRRNDRLQFQLDKLEYYRYLSGVTDALVQEDRATSLDLEVARFDVDQQQAVVDRLKLELEQQERRLVLGWVRKPNSRIEPMASMNRFLDVLAPALSQSAPVQTHPDYRVQQLGVTLATLNERETARDRWPDVSAYYRYEKHYNEALPDTESNTWGLSVSYPLFDLPTRQRQARSRADLTIARWQAQDRLCRLSFEDRQRQSHAEALRKELVLNQRGIGLAQQALDQELARYRSGLSSYRDVRQRQQDLLERKLSRLDTQIELATSLIELGYYRQVDWLEVVTNRRQGTANKDNEGQ